VIGKIFKLRQYPVLEYHADRGMLGQLDSISFVVKSLNHCRNACRMS
jgi:hypothetical protein